MEKKVWLSPRALKLHATVLIVVPACLALCVWQIDRALSGNSLSWAYVFEWPFFAGYAVYMWWRFLHEGTAATPPPAAETNGAGGRTGTASAPTVDIDAASAARQEKEGAELAAYNRYLAQLAEQDESAGR
jgi:hypothetical protein